VRASGILDDVTGLGAHDHLCFSYDMSEDFSARAIQFLRDGLVQGLQVRYIGGGTEDALWGDLTELLDLNAALRHGAVGVASLDSMFDVAGVVDAERQARVCAEATAAALDAGFMGLRIAIEATPLVRTPEQIDAFARYEHLIDTYMAVHPFSAMCAYNRWELGAATVAALACMHPLGNQGATSFRAYAVSGADLALGGELDVSVQAQFSQALDRAHLRAAGPEMVFDGRNLEFLDHRALLSLRDRALRSGSTAVLQTHSRLPNRLIQMFSMEGIRAERLQLIPSPNGVMSLTD
jgi:hypothetical protein